MSLSIRRGVPADTDVIVDMNACMALETELLALDRATLTAGVRAVLTDASRGMYFIAEREGRVVGQAMVTFEWSDWRNAWMWWVQSVYVPVEARRQGIYRAIYQHIVEAARSAGDVAGIRLYVMDENHAAQKTYASLGMKRTHYLLLEQSPLPADEANREHRSPG